MAIVSANNVTVLERDGFLSSSVVSYRLTLDAPATAPVIVEYGLQGGTAQADIDFRDTFSQTAQFAVGQQELVIEVRVSADDIVEGDETFDLVVVGRQNASFPEGAAGLRIGTTIFDDDDDGDDPETGETGPATLIFGPEPENSIFPTLSLRDQTFVESDSNSQREQFLVTLDRPAIADVTLLYHIEGVTASQSTDDIDEGTGFLTIQAGQQAAFIPVRLDGDQVAEGTETFNVILTGIQNAVLQDGGAALRATGTILDDDGTDAGLSLTQGDFAEPIPGPAPVSATLPTLRVQDVSVVEGNGGFAFQSPSTRFVLTLDRPAEEDVTLTALFNNGTATSGLGDFQQTFQSIVIRAGHQSVSVPVVTLGDIEIEGDETFSLVLSNLQGARFEKGGAAMVATGTILDNDGGAISGEAGIGGPGQIVRPPESGPNGEVRVQVVGTSIGEGDVQSDFAYVYLVLSEPAPADLSVTYATMAGTADEDADFTPTGRTVTINEGIQSIALAVEIRGDTAVEGDETLSVVFSDLDGATFVGGGSTASADVLIRGNDGVGTEGTAPTGPEFDFYSDDFDPGRVIVGDDTAEDLRGGSGDDIILGNGGNDTLVGGAGDDLLTGGGGRDAFAFIRGNDAGADRVTDFGGNDVIALDDRYFGRLAGNDIDVRAVTREQAQSALSSGNVSYNRATAELEISGNVVAILEGGPRLSFEDVFLF